MVLKHLFTTKPLLVGVCSNLYSFIYDQYKIGLVFTLLLRTFSFVSDLSRFLMEVSHLKDILRKNAFPIKLVDNCNKTFLNKKFLHTPVDLIIEKKEWFIALPYLGNLSLALGSYLQDSINKIFLILRSRLFLSPRRILVIFTVLKIKCLFTL